MTCWNNFITIHAADNMYSLIFLNSQEQAKLQQQLQVSVENWLREYTLNQQVSIQVSPVKLLDFIELTGIAAFSRDGQVVKYCDQNLDWETMIYGDTLHMCPRDTLFTTTVSKIKNIFLEHLLGFESVISKEKESTYFPSAIDAYLHIRIQNEEFGVFDYYAGHTHFANLIGKISSPVSRIKLEDRVVAANSIKIPVRVSLNFGEISFKSLLDMEPGCVIESEFPVDNQFSIELCNEAVATASMGKKSDNLAFLIKGKVL